MDRQFLQFWGDFFTNSAKGQRQLEDMTEWMQQGFKGVDYLTVLFQKSYGLDRISEAGDEYVKMWKEAIENFEKSLNDYLNLMGVVPRKEHQILLNKYESLGEEVASFRKVVANQKKEISACEKAVSAKERSLEDKNKIIAEQNKVVMSQKKEINSYEKTADRLRKELDSQKEAIADQKKSIADQKKVIAAQEKKLSSTKPR